MAVPALLHHTDGHAGEHLNSAQHQRADHDGHGVVQRVEQRRQGNGAGRVDELTQLGDEVPQKAAGQRTEDKGHDAAPEDHLHEAPVVGPLLLQKQQRADDHGQAVAHIRHHHAEEEDEKRRHDGVGIHAVVGGHGVLLRDAVHGAGQHVAAELHRHVGDILRRGVADIVGTIQRVQPRCQPGQPGRRYPAVEGHDAAVGQQPLPVLLPHETGVQPVAAQLEIGQLIAQRCQRLTGVLLLCGGLPQSAFQRRQVLLRRAAPSLQLSAGEAEAPQQLQRRRRDGFVGQQQ